MTTQTNNPIDEPNPESVDEIKALYEDYTRLCSKRKTKIGFSRLRKSLLNLSKFCASRRQDLLSQRKSFVVVKVPRKIPKKPRPPKEPEETPPKETPPKETPETPKETPKPRLRGRRAGTKKR